MAAEVKALFEGTWNECKAENVEAFLTAVGISEDRRKVILGMKATMKVEVNGDEICSTTFAGPNNEIKVTTKFILGKEFDVTEGEIPAKGTCSFLDGKLEAEIKPNDASKAIQTFIREIVNGELVQTMTAGGVTAKRTFTKA
ncbi:Fatty acid-binding protein [Mactra antiquata]